MIMRIEGRMTTEGKGERDQIINAFIHDVAKIKSNYYSSVPVGRRRGKSLSSIQAGLFRILYQSDHIGTLFTS